MIFINTSLDIALQRNEKRDRVLPKGVVIQSHREVTKNIGGYQGLFGGSNFLVIDNNKDLDEEKAQKRFNMLVKRGINKFISKPIKNRIGQSWMRKQKLLKKMTKESLEELISESFKTTKESLKLVKKLEKKYRVNSRLKIKSGKTRGEFDFINNIIVLRPEYKSFKDFLETVFHEIYHARDSRRYGKKEFVKLYQTAGDIVVNKGYDFHDHNPYEKAARRAEETWKKFSVVWAGEPPE